MNQNRKPFHADLVVFFVCWSVACFFAGKWMGEEQMADKVKPCYEMKKQNLDMSKTQQRRFINYWKSQS